MFRFSTKESSSASSGVVRDDNQKPDHGGRGRLSAQDGLSTRETHHLKRQKKMGFAALNPSCVLDDEKTKQGCLLIDFAVNVGMLVFPFP
jgi:hypothetical protein